jgi:hypothetical protein
MFLYHGYGRSKKLSGIDLPAAFHLRALVRSGFEEDLREFNLL